MAKVFNRLKVGICKLWKTYQALHRIHIGASFFINEEELNFIPLEIAVNYFVVFSIGIYVNWHYGEFHIFLGPIAIEIYRNLL